MSRNRAPFGFGLKKCRWVATDGLNHLGSLSRSNITLALQRDHFELKPCSADHRPPAGRSLRSAMQRLKILAVKLQRAKCMKDQVGRGPPRGVLRACSRPEAARHMPPPY